MKAVRKREHRLYEPRHAKRGTRTYHTVQPQTSRHVTDVAADSLMRAYAVLASISLAFCGLFFVVPYFSESFTIPRIANIVLTRDTRPFPLVTRFGAVTTPPPPPLLVPARNYTKASDGSVFIMSAYERCRENKSLLLNVWEDRRKINFVNPAYVCCFLLPGGSVRASNVTMRFRFNGVAKLSAAKLMCPVPKGTSNYAVTIVSTGLSSSNGNQTTASPIDLALCPTSLDNFVIPTKPFVPGPYKSLEGAEMYRVDHNCLPKEKRGPHLDKQESYSFAICGKIVFGNIGAHLLIEWVEYNFKMGVSKIVLYTYNLNARTMRVLNHYRQGGRLKVLSFDFPKEGIKRDVGQKITQAWHDEQVVLHDCYERLRLFKFVAVVDIDEFIVPTMDQGFQQLMSRMRKINDFASMFHLKIQYHIIDWAGNVSTSTTDLMTLQYRNHTMPIAANMKTITMPGRTTFGGVLTHTVKMYMAPFIRYEVPPKLAAVSHFRHCRRQWKHDTCFTQKRTNTSQIFRIIRGPLVQNILKTKKKVMQN